MLLRRKRVESMQGKVEAPEKDGFAGLPQVVTAYLQAAEREFGRLEQGLAVADPSLLGKAAHALKSGSYNVGALQFAACCQAVESAAREGRNGELPALVDELRLAWGPVDAELKDLLKALRP